VVVSVTTVVRCVPDHAFHSSDAAMQQASRSPRLLRGLGDGESGFRRISQPTHFGSCFCGQVEFERP